MRPDHTRGKFYPAILWHFYFLASAPLLGPARRLRIGLLCSIRIQTNLAPSSVKTGNLTALNGLFLALAHKFIQAEKGNDQYTYHRNCNQKRIRI
jgi:hypothetical protein